MHITTNEKSKGCIKKEIPRTHESDWATVSVLLFTAGVHGGLALGPLSSTCGLGSFPSYTAGGDTTFPGKRGQIRCYTSTGAKRLPLKEHLVKFPNVNFIIKWGNAVNCHKLTTCSLAEPLPSQSPGPNWGPPSQAANHTFLEGKNTPKYQRQSI